MLGNHLTATDLADLRLGNIGFVTTFPGPGVSVPECRQQIEMCCLIAAVVNCDSDQDVVGRTLGVFNEDIEIAIAIEDPRVGQFVLKFLTRSLTIDIQQFLVGEDGLRILVQSLAIGMSRGGIEVEVAVLDVFAVITFVAGEAIQTFLEDRVDTIPQGEGKAESALAVGETEQAIFTPAVRAPCSIVVREMAPDAAVGGVVFANRSPLAFGEIRTPTFPVCVRLTTRFCTQSAAFCRRRL